MYRVRLLSDAKYDTFARIANQTGTVSKSDSSLREIESIDRDAIDDGALPTSASRSVDPVTQNR